MTRAHRDGIGECSFGWPMRAYIRKTEKGPLSGTWRASRPGEWYSPSFATYQEALDYVVRGLR